jgi:small subunit ribosomal protein S1
VLRLMYKGVVVDLGNDIEGFVPMSQLGIADIQNPGDAVKEGQAVELKVLEVDPIHHRIVLAATGWPQEAASDAAGTIPPAAPSAATASAEPTEPSGPAEPAEPAAPSTPGEG